MKRVALAGILFLASCEQLPEREQAEKLLRQFCNLHRAGITQVLLTQEQLQAGTRLCAAVGMRLGSDAP